MPLAALAAGVSLLIGAGSIVPPPSRPAAWHQLGAAVTSAKPGKPVRFFRTATSPKSLGIVLRSSSSRPIRVAWHAYCEFSSDDDIMEEHQGTASGVGTVTVYPPVFDGATTCNVSVNATPPRAGKVAAAIFAAAS